MWKDFFYFTKGQRIGIFVLLTLIVITLVACYVYPWFVVEKTEPENKFLEEARQFEHGLVLRDSILKAGWDSTYNSRYENLYTAKDRSENYTLFAFDPNRADSISMTKLGIKKYVVSNILKFRAKGGYFKTAENLSKVYGLTTEKFNELLPYIVIADVKPIAKDTVIKQTALKQKNIVVELNTADTAELMKVYGIGRGFAKAILRFRMQTGGFVNVEQLKELYGMTDANYAKISPNCKVDADKIRKININTASVEKLNAHPYLNFYESKAIYEYRRKKGKIKSIDELRQLSELKPETLSKISAYISFE